MWFASVFSHFMIFLFIYWCFPMLCRSFFCLHSSTHLFLLLLPLLLVSNPRNQCWYQCQGAYYVCFLLGFLWFQILYSSFNPFWGDYSEWCKMWIQFHSSACGYPVFLAPVIEETILSPLSTLLSLSNIQFSSVQFSLSVVSYCLRPHESQHARPPCPSRTPGVHSDSRPLSQWCHPAISSSVVPFSSCPQSLDCICKGLFLDSILFHWSVCLYLCWYHTILITIVV